MTLNQENSGVIRKLFMRHVGPSVAAQIVSTIGPVVCGAIAGTEYGKTGLAVNSLFSPFFFLAGFFGTIIASGSTNLAAKYIANDDSERVGEIYTLGLVLSAGSAVVICLLLALFREPVLELIAGNGDLTEAARRYFMPTVWYMFFTVVIHIPLFWSRLAGRPTVSLILTLTMAGTNIALSVLFTFGLDKGLESLAVSQALSTVIALVVSLAFLHLPKNGFRLKKPKHIREDASAIFMMGSPWGLSRLYRFIDILVLNIILLNAAGPEAVAIYGVLNILLRFVTAFCNGVTGMASPVAGVLCEERDTVSLKQLSRSVFSLGNAVMTAAAVLIYLFRENVASAYGIGGESFFYALACFCVYILFYTNGTLLISWYAAVKKVMPANIAAFAQDMVLLPLFALLLSGGGNAVWLHLPFAGAALVLVLPVLLPYARKRGLSLPLLHVKQDRNSVLAFSAGREQASEASAAVAGFCEEKGLKTKQTMLLSMAVEELITLITNHGTNDEISVRLSFFESGVILRLRSGGKKFDPVNYYKKRLESGENMEEFMDLMGIKYIVGAAEAVYYTETFGINNLVIII